MVPHLERETLTRALFRRDSILIWVLRTFAKYRREYRRLRDEAVFPHLRWIEFARPREAAQFLKSVEGASSPSGR